MLHPAMIPRGWTVMTLVIFPVALPRYWQLSYWVNCVWQLWVELLWQLGLVRTFIQTLFSTSASALLDFPTKYLSSLHLTVHPPSIYSDCFCLTRCVLYLILPVCYLNPVPACHLLRISCVLDFPAVNERPSSPLDCLHGLSVAWDVLVLFPKSMTEIVLRTKIVVKYQWSVKNRSSQV